MTNMIRRWKFAFTIIAIGCTSAFAERKPDSPKNAEVIVWGTVTSVAVRETFEQKQYVVKIKIENTERTSGAQHGETISVYCFQRKPSLLPIATEGGHKAVPKEGQRIRALVKTRHNRLEGIYPDWFHVLDLNAKELEATKWVWQMRGDLLCDDEHPGRPIASLILTRIRISSINDTGLKHLAAFQSLRSLDIRFEKITDEGLRDVAAL